MLPVYQPDRAFLEKALAGPLETGRSANEFQIEVVDDCSPSTDVAAMVREIAGDRVVVSQSPQNMGLAGCWNLCVERARGEWVHILHQDDIVDPRFYASLDEVIAANPTAVAAHTRHAVCDEDDHWHELSVLEIREPGVISDFAVRIASGQRVQCPSVVVRRDVYDAVGVFDPKWKYVLDWEMWSRVAMHGPWAYVPNILSVYRTHSGSETQKLSKGNLLLQEFWDGGVTINQYLPPHLRSEAWRGFQAHFAATVTSIAKSQIDQGEAKRAIASLARFPWCTASKRWIPIWLKLWFQIGMHYLGAGSRR